MAETGADSETDELDLYRRMVLIRRFEERVDELYRSARMPGLAHL
jgi:TPP-dependent pyruvate/acetoin dehydrogenase alpha subunit